MNPNFAFGHAGPCIIKTLWRSALTSSLLKLDGQVFSIGTVAAYSVKYSALVLVAYKIPQLFQMLKSFLWPNFNLNYSSHPSLHIWKFFLLVNIS